MTHQQANDRQSAEFKTGRIIVLSVSHFIHDVYSSFLSPMLPLLIEKLSMSLTRAGLLSTVIQLPALLNPFIGVWADRISVRWFIILAPSMTAIPMSLIGLAALAGIAESGSAVYNSQIGAIHTGGQLFHRNQVAVACHMSP